MKSTTISVARIELASLFQEAAESGEPIQITHRGRVIGELRAVTNTPAYGKRSEDGQYKCEGCGTQLRLTGTNANEMAGEIAEHLDHVVAGEAA